MRLDGSDDGNRSSSLDDADDGRIPAHQMEVLVAHLFDKYDTTSYRLSAATATAIVDAAATATGSSCASSSSGGASFPSDEVAPPLLSLLPPHARFLMAPGGLTRRPTGLECFEMADCADPRGTGRMGVRGFLAGVSEGRKEHRARIEQEKYH